MNDNCEPNPEFVSNLEREMHSALRRRRLCNGDPRANGHVWRRLGQGSLALALASMLLGSAGTYAVTRTWENPDSELHLARAQVNLEIARMREDQLEMELARFANLHEQGLTTPDELTQIELQADQVQTETEIRTLDLEETQLTGRAPNYALFAPLVRGRDFVSQRLSLHREIAERQCQSAALQAEQLSRRIEQGYENAHAAAQGDLMVAGVEAEVARLDRHLELRRAFLAGELTAAQIELRNARIEVGAQREAAARQLQLRQVEYDRFQALAEQNLVTDAEFRAVENGVRQAEMQLRIAELELSLLEKKLADPPA